MRQKRNNLALMLYFALAVDLMATPMGTPQRRRRK